MRRISAAHLPPDEAISAERVVAERDDVRVVAPDLDPARIDRVCTALLTAQQHLREIPVRRIITAVDAAARRLLSDDEPERHDVLLSLRAISGYSAPMATHLLDRVARDWLTPALERLLLDEFDGPAAVESFVHAGPGRRIRAVAPALGLHVFAGNVPGVGVTSMVRALLIRSAVLGKSAAAEPVLGPAFARLLAQVDPQVGACVAVTYWRGGDTALEDAVLARAGLAVHYGGASAVAGLRARAPAHVRFVEHGPRISFALIRAAESGMRAPADLARAVALFDQQGCVSPQIAYVIGTREQARDVAGATARELAEVQLQLPRGRIDAGEAAAIRDARTRAEFGAFAGSGSELWAPPELHYSVILSDDPAFEGTCLNRTLLIKHVPDFDTVVSHIARFGDVLQTVGVAGFDEEEVPRVATALGAAGVSRITSLATMPWPPPSWHHDGRGPLRELVRWVDLES